MKSLTPKGPLLALDRTGRLIVPAPVDYLSWTERVSRFFTSVEAAEARERLVWNRGGYSPRAKQELEAAGWSVLTGELSSRRTP